MTNVRVYVTLRRSVLDPQGEAVREALGALGFGGVGEVRVGKFIELQLEDDGSPVAPRVEQMCAQLLANPVIEDYRIEVVGS